jgi:hypothetical protein
MIAKYFRIRPQYILLACTVGLIVVVFANQNAIAKQLDDWQIMPRPQCVTELYFANEQTLPRTTKAGTEQKVEFVVRNIEYRTTKYRYDVFAVSGDDGSARPLGGGVLSLDHDQTRTISEVVKMPSIGSRAAIKVELKYDGFAEGSDELSAQKQSIHYWMKVVEQ